MTDKEPSPPNMTMADAAEYLGVTTRSIQEMINDGRLRAYSLGPRVIRFRRPDIDSALQPHYGWKAKETNI